MNNFEKKFPMTFHQLGLEAENLRDDLLQIVDSETKNILLCASVADLPEILLQAQQVGLMTEDHHFIISSLDMHTIDLEQFQYGETIVTGLRLVMPESPIVESVTEFFKSQHLQQNQDLRNDSEVLERLSAEKILLEHALIYDAGKIFRSQVEKRFSHSGIGQTFCDVNMTLINADLTLYREEKSRNGVIKFLSN